MQANLSRVHHIIKSVTEEFNRLSSRVCSMQLEFVFRIFEKTDETDFGHFNAQLAKRREEYKALSERMARLLEYSDYLKNCLAEANEKYGIGTRLTRAASLGRLIRHLGSFVELVTANHSAGLELIQPVDFYKSTFTEQTKIYDLPVYMFNETDLERLRNEYNRLLTEQQELNDEIATLNQKHSLEIMTFDEFGLSGDG